MSLNVLTQGGGGGEAASIFVTGLSEESTVTSMKDGKTINGVWAQKENPESVVPAGYTQLEYIESTGTQHINTKYTPTTNTEWTTDCQFVGNQALGYDGGMMGSLGQNTSQRFQFGYITSGVWQIGVGSAYTNVGTADNNRHTFTVCGNGSVRIDSVEYTTGGTATGGQIHLFNWYYVGSDLTRPCAAKLYSSTITENGELVRDFVPAKRNSDGEIGLYDLVNNEFHTNAGTGAFTAGAEISATVGGFIVEPIKDYGTWTVAATDGVKTKTQDVLVDAAVEYKIEMDYLFYLYNEGDECENITGGYEQAYRNVAWVKNSDHLYMNTAGKDVNAKIYTKNTLDLSGYSKLMFDMELTIGKSGAYNEAGFGALNSTLDNWVANVFYPPNQQHYISRSVVEVNLTGVSGTNACRTGCLMNMATGTQTIKIYKIWAE